MASRIVKKSIAVLTAIACFAVGILAYAESSFSPIYSGTLSSTNPEIYMRISDSDALMHRIIYNDNGNSRFLTISNPESLYFSKDHLYVTYQENNNGKYTTSDGTVVGYTKRAVYIQTEDVSATFTIFGKVKSITVTYNNREYTGKK